MGLLAQQMALVINSTPGSKRELDNEKRVKPEDSEEELLPGIINDITLIHIFRKVPWRDRIILSSVCRGWQQALRAGYRDIDERVRSYLTETLVVLDVILPDSNSHAIALYSAKDERFYYVPPLPNFRQFSESYQCVSLDNKLYVLGKTTECTKGSKEVYVLDLIGERQWRQCASMKKERTEFGCGVMDGKIYVFGGTSKYVPVAGAEVYDPKLNSWSVIPYNGVSRFLHRITVAGEEFVLHGGMFVTEAYQAYLDSKSGSGGGLYDSRLKWTQEALFLEFYNPVTKEYRKVEPFCSRGRDVVFGTQGNFYLISWKDIRAYHLDNGETMLHLRKFSVEKLLNSPRVDIFDPFVVTLVNGELLTLVHWGVTLQWTRVPKGNYTIDHVLFEAEDTVSRTARSLGRKHHAVGNAVLL